MDTKARRMSNLVPIPGSPSAVLQSAMDRLPRVKGVVLILMLDDDSLECEWSDNLDMPDLSYAARWLEKEIDGAIVEGE